MGIRSGKGAEFDLAIGQLDRALSVFLGLYNADLDAADIQTLKHHAEDLIGCGKKMLAGLAKPAVKVKTAEEAEAERRRFQEENPPWS